MSRRSESQTTVSVQLGTDRKEYRDIEEYSIDSNVLSLMDTATVRIRNDGKLTFRRGDPGLLMMSDPRVSGGQKVQMMKGVIIEIDKQSDSRSGSIWTVTIGDLGWHLVNTCGPLWKCLMNTEWKKFVQDILDPTWGFAGVDTDNAFNRQIQQGLKLNQSRAAIAAARAPEDVFIPPVCFESGDVIADKLVTYARRVKRLVNVSADGWLQIFAPDYTQPVRFILEYHAAGDARRRRNNVKEPVRIRESIDGIYTDVVCTWQVTVPSVMPDRFNPHAGTSKSTYSDSSQLPFKRLLTFQESDALSQQMGNDRVQQKFDRGLFDSWIGEYTVDGHVMNNLFISADTMVNVNDSVSPYSGNAYVGARRFVRSAQQGTVTQMQLRLPNLLRA